MESKNILETSYSNLKTDTLKVTNPLARVAKANQFIEIESALTLFDTLNLEEKREVNLSEELKRIGDKVDAAFSQIYDANSGEINPKFDPAEYKKLTDDRLAEINTEVLPDFLKSAGIEVTIDQLKAILDKRTFWDDWDLARQTLKEYSDIDIPENITTAQLERAFEVVTKSDSYAGKIIKEDLLPGLAESPTPIPRTKEEKQIYALTDLLANFTWKKRAIHSHNWEVVHDNPDTNRFTRDTVTTFPHMLQLNYQKGQSYGKDLPDQDLIAAVTAAIEISKDSSQFNFNNLQ